MFGEQKKFKYYLRTIPEMNVVIKPVNGVVQTVLLPPIAGEVVSEKERKLY